MSRAVTASVLACLALAAAGRASAADGPSLVPLSDSQLDSVAGGAASSADGESSARGGSARADTSVAALVQTGGTNAEASADGLAVASASASAGALATASSSLSLVVAFP